VEFAMTLFKPPSESVLLRAAELRAAGCSWELVARTLHRRLAKVRRWPEVFAERWQAALQRAERRNLAEASAEAVLVLRQLLRSSTDTVRRDAARYLVDLWMKLARLDRQSEAESAPPTSDRLFAEFLEAHSDEELQELALRLRQAPLPLQCGSSGNPVAGAE
jgi:hypothetical protein